MSAPPGFRGPWLAKLSHDLRNQLSPMRTATQLLQSGRLDGERQAEMLQMIERQVQRMVRMLDDLSEYGRLPVLQLKRERVPLDYAIDVALAEVGKRLTEAGHALVFEPPAERIVVEGDRGRLAALFVRLLDNAIRFTPAGGVISIDVAKEGMEAVARVRDGGPGLGDDRFDAMFALPDAPRASENLGISLLLVRAAAEAHGGSVHAHTLPGRGAELAVRLPLAE